MAGTKVTRQTVTDDDGSGLTGTIFNASFFTTLWDNLDAFVAQLLVGTGPFEKPALYRKASTVTGNQDNYAVDGLASGSYTGVALWQWNGASACTLRGLAGGLDGRVLLIQNIASATLTLAHENTNSTAANRLSTSGAADLSLAAGGWALAVYDSTLARWRVTSLVAGSGGNDWASVTMDTVYLAARDGFVVVDLDGGSDGIGDVQILSDAANPPTTQRARGGCVTTTPRYTSICCPVKAGDRFKCVTTTEAGTVTFTGRWFGGAIT